MDHGRSVVVPFHRLAVVLGPVGYSVLCVPALIANALGKESAPRPISLHTYPPTHLSCMIMSCYPARGSMGLYIYGPV